MVIRKQRTNDKPMTEGSVASDKTKEVFIGAIDQGTTSSKFIIFSLDGEVISVAQEEHGQIHLKPGYCEHNPESLMVHINSCIEQALLKFEEKGYKRSQLASVGVTNQRETTVLWDAETGQPFYNAIVWHDVRNGPLVDELCNKVGGKYGLYAKTGLSISTYPSATKLQWIINNVPEAREAMKEGRARFGTIDSWVLWRLTGRHITDITNASRTMLFDIHKKAWDPELCALVGVDPSCLPEVVPSSAVYGKVTSKNCPLSKLNVVISGCMGDQQAALFGQNCFHPGEMKCTYGTGCFLLQQAGPTAPEVDPASGLLTTIAYDIDGTVCYAIEGAVACAGSMFQWLRDDVGIYSRTSEIEPLAREVDSSEGVILVPAFTGLFAPRWRPDARACIVGMTFRTNRCHIMRAALDAVSFQVVDVVKAMGGAQKLSVDGGMTVNRLLMQTQADQLGVDVEVSSMPEVTALGAAMASGLAVGLYKDFDDIKAHGGKKSTVTPTSTAEQREAWSEQWEKGIARALDWV
ncbi:Glycerol kinase [Carpediemonas membranifera]|uniref:glycerol kinase n=1 Tax=Carpediemonas membranifera TaxID=201153 RepID=A0A8J6B007_9EUKA|nr:Glycerol kinase [Carpediemonas membranifera]|eukprot:KAG9395505.1 Glycerol kinase [Carpediemonas membranifera]